MWTQFVEDNKLKEQLMCKIRTPAGWNDKTEHRQVLGCRWLRVLGSGNTERGRKELFAVPVRRGLWQFVC